MNPLVNHANLFATGEFGLKLPNGEILYAEAWEFLTVRDIESCTLIARPIEDMTVKEVSQINEDQYYGSTYQQIIKNLKAVNINMRTDHALQVLGFGVYPGPQEDFGDTVIDTRTLTNA